MKLPVVFLTFVLLAPATLFAKDKPDQEPIAWGQLTQNTGCVIFAEGTKTTGMFWGVAVTTKTVGKLTTIETQNYAFDQKVVLETQESMNDLMQRSQKDHVKFVKIPEKYSPDLLDKARAMCKQDQAGN